MGTFTFLFTDIEGSTRLWSTHADDMPDALAGHDQLMDEVVTSHRGRIFKHTGDGIAAVFESGRDAVEAAVEIQRRLANTDFPGVGHLRVRAGLHSGEVDERGGDFFGIAVNRTARIMDAGHGGQILASAVTVGLASDAATFRDLGSFRLADLTQPERIFQVVADGLTDDHPPLRTLDRASHNLPVFASSFVGREQERSRLAELINESRLVTVTGVGGAGKTRLATQVVAEMVDAYPGGVWLVELAPVSDPERVDSAVRTALGFRHGDDQDERDALIAHLQDRRLVLVMDNCEHLIDTVANLVEDVLAHAPSVQVVATSRELLGVPGEVSYGLRSMSVPAVDADLTTVRRADAVRLFEERAASARPGFEVDEANRKSVVEICRRLDGMPLAIELAAARIRSFGPAQIAEHLDQRFRLLTGGARTALPRQQTLTATIEWSYRLLTEAERALFRRLSVFQGGFTFEAVAAVCAGEPVDELDLLELLPALVDKSLVIVESGEDSDRYRLLETLRQYARDRLDDSGDGDAWRRRHATYYATISRSATTESLYGPKGPDTRARIQAEADNIRQAVRWAIDAGLGELAADALYGLGRTSMYQGTWGEVVDRYEEILRLELPPRVRAESLGGLGLALANSPRRREAAEVLQRSIDLYRELEDGGAPSAHLADFPRALLNLGYSYFVMGEAGEFNERYTEVAEQALEVARRLGDIGSEVVALSGLAHHRDPRGDPESARQVFVAAAEAARRSGFLDPDMFAPQRAFFEFDQGDWEAAARYFGAAVVHAETDHRELEQLINLNAVWALLGKDGAAEEFRDRVAEFYRDPEVRAAAQGLQTVLAFGAGLDAAAGALRRVGIALGASRSVEELAGALRWDLHKLMNDAVDQARAELGEEEFDQAVQAGQAMSLEAVIDFVSTVD